MLGAFVLPKKTSPIHSTKKSAECFLFICSSLFYFFLWLVFFACLSSLFRCRLPAAVIAAQLGASVEYHTLRAIMLQGRRTEALVLTARRLYGNTPPVQDAELRGPFLGARRWCLVCPDKD